MLTFILERTSGHPVVRRPQVFEDGRQNFIGQAVIRPDVTKHIDGFGADGAFDFHGRTGVNDPAHTLFDAKLKHVKKHVEVNLALPVVFLFKTQKMRLHFLAVQDGGVISDQFAVEVK